MVGIYNNRAVVAVRQLPAQVCQKCNQVAKNILTGVKQALVNIAQFFAALSRGVANTCSYLKNKSVEAVQSGCIRVRSIFKRKQPVTPAGTPVVSRQSSRASSPELEDPQNGSLASAFPVLASIVSGAQVNTTASVTTPPVTTGLGGLEDTSLNASSSSQAPAHDVVVPTVVEKGNVEPATAAEEIPDVLKNTMIQEIVKALTPALSRKWDSLSPKQQAEKAEEALSAAAAKDVPVRASRRAQTAERADQKKLEAVQAELRSLLRKVKIAA